MTRMMIGSLVLLVASCAQADPRDEPELPPPRTVERVDLARYVGTWYEIASYPQRFQKGCTATQATYSLRPDGKIDVVNQCNRDSLDGKKTAARGKAKVVDKTSNAKLKVSFFWFVWGDYWIIDLGREYEYAVVGHPERKYLWILSRTPKMEPDVYEGILRRLEAQHYDLARLQRTLHAERGARSS